MIHMFFYISPIYMASFKSLFLLLVVLVCAAFAVVSSQVVDPFPDPNGSMPSGGWDVCCTACNSTINGVPETGPVGVTCCGVSKDAKHCFCCLQGRVCNYRGTGAPAEDIRAPNTSADGGLFHCNRL